jgi:hypothetical protein
MDALSGSSLQRGSSAPSLGGRSKSLLRAVAATPRRSQTLHVNGVPDSKTATATINNPMNDLEFFQPAPAYVRPRYPYQPTPRYFTAAAGGQESSSTFETLEPAADGFVWLAKLLFNRRSQSRRDRPVQAAAAALAAHQKSVQRRRA